MVSSLTKCRFFTISWETNRGKPKPSESGSRLGLWKFFQVGSGMKLSTMLQAFSATTVWSNIVNETLCENGHRRSASYSPGRILMYIEMWLPSPVPFPFRKIEACDTRNAFFNELNSGRDATIVCDVFHGTHLQLVSVLTSIKRWTNKLHSLLRFRLRHFGGVVRDLPYERTRVI